MAKKKELNLKQKKFCEVFLSPGEFFGNGIHSYCEAYNLDSSTKKDYNTAKVNACKLLTKTNITTYLNTLLDESGLNDQTADKQLLFLMLQNVEFSAKISAIREYNKLRQRIIEKQEINLTGMPYNDEFKPNGE